MATTPIIIDKEMIKHQKPKRTLILFNKFIILTSLYFKERMKERCLFQPEEARGDKNKKKKVVKKKDRVTI